MRLEIQRIEGNVFWRCISIIFFILLIKGFVFKSIKKPSNFKFSIMKTVHYLNLTNFYCGNEKIWLTGEPNFSYFND